MKFRVTEKAGKFVAGHMVTHGQYLELTEKQAEYELARGTIERLAAKVAEPKSGGKHGGKDSRGRR